MTANEAIIIFSGLAILGGYFIGSIPSGLLLAKLFRLKEIPKNLDGYVSFGSLWHSKHWLLAIITLILEISKIVCIFVVFATNSPHVIHEYTYDCQYHICSPKTINIFGSEIEFVFLTMLAGFLAFMIGQIFPCWTKFKGGTGTLSALLVIILPSLGTAPLLPLAFILTWLIVLLATRYMCLANLISITVWPFIVLTGALIRSPKFSTVTNFIPLAFLYVAIAFLVILGHREHIARLLKGEESKISFKKKNKELKA